MTALPLLPDRGRGDHSQPEIDASHNDDGGLRADQRDPVHASQNRQGGGCGSDADVDGDGAPTLQVLHGYFLRSNSTWG